MQAIILAAGMSKRLRPLTDNTPKCLLKIQRSKVKGQSEESGSSRISDSSEPHLQQERGRTILEMTVENVLKNGIEEFVMVTGYRENMIKDYIAERFPKLKITYLTNSDYENNNNSYSLWMTKDYIKGDCILLDSDILFDYKIIEKLLNSGFDNCLAVKRHQLGEEEIKVIIDDSNKILHIGKHLNPADCFGESIGIERFSYSFFSKLGEVLERKIVKEKNVNEFYEASFQELYDKGNSMYSVDVSEYKCMEIDFAEDLIRAQSLFSD